VSPSELAALGKHDRKKLKDLIQNYITTMEADEKSPGCIAGILKGVKSWLAHNEVELKRKIRI
jgi:hypothetical protein